MHKKKKSTIGIEQIILAIVALIVVTSTITVIKKQVDSPVAYLLGMGNISAFDDSIVERYETTRALEGNTIDSVEALIYAINRLAVVDTYGTQQGTTIDKITNNLGEDLDVYNQDFGSTSVTWTLLDQRNIHLDPDNELRDFVRRIIECDFIFQDKQENTKCFGVYVTELKTKITKEAVLNKMVEYYRSEECEKMQYCKERIKDILGHDPDGSNWNPLTLIKNLANLENFEWKVGYLDKTINEDIIQICGDTKRKNAVMVTSDQNDCVPPKSEKKAFGFSVINFNLPQEVQKSDNYLVWGIEEWLNAYGDPRYLLYYEKFPEGEDAHWRASAYKVGVGTIVTVEGVFLLFDLIPYSGPVLKAIAKRVLGITLIEKLVKTILVKPAKKIGLHHVKNVIFSAGKWMKEAAAKIGGLATRPARWVVENLVVKPTKRIITKAIKTQLIGDYVETIAKKTIRSRLKKTLGKSFTDLNSIRRDSLVKEIEDAYIESFTRAQKQFKGDIFDPYGKISDQVLDILQEEFDATFKGLQLGELTEKQIEDKAREIALRFGDIPTTKGGILLDDNYFSAITKRTEEAKQELLMENKDFVKRVQSELGDTNYNMLYKELNEGMLQDLQTATLRKIPQKLRYNYDIASSTLTKLKRLAGTGMTDQELKDVWQEIVSETDYLETMIKNHPSDARRFISSKSDIVDMIWDPKTNQIRWDLVGDLGGDLSADTKKELSKNFDKFLQTHVSDNFRFESWITTKTLSGIQKKRHLVAASAAFSAIRLNSIKEKHISVGTNSLGLRTPYEATAAFEEIEINDDSYNKDPLEYLETEYFPTYLDKEKRDEGVIGLLPEVEKYYLSLTRDKERFWFDQDPIRFHLASPCKADLFMRVSTCECYGEPRESTIDQSSIPLIGSIFEHDGIYLTGQKNELEDGRIINFDFDPKDNDEMLYKLDEDGRPIKYCEPAKWYRFDTLRKPKCIQIDPILADTAENEYNYCYHGSGGIEHAAIATGLNFALPMSLGLAATPLGGPVGFAFGSAAGGVIGGITYGYYGSDHQWPSHD